VVEEMIAWTHQQLDADERIIREAAGDYFYSDGHGAAVQRWFERWNPEDPDGMLAEVKAKRQILDLLAATLATSSEYFTVESCDEIDAILAEAVLRKLAQPYAERPGWREEWAV
jgi:uncharacterized protein DUF6221